VKIGPAPALGAHSAEVLGKLRRPTAQKGRRKPAAVE
jgi:hypothetical protein